MNKLSSEIWSQVKQYYANYKRALNKTILEYKKIQKRLNLNKLKQ